MVAVIISPCWAGSGRRRPPVRLKRELLRRQATRRRSFRARGVVGRIARQQLLRLQLLTLRRRRPGALRWATATARTTTGTAGPGPPGPPGPPPGRAATGPRAGAGTAGATARGTGTEPGPPGRAPGPPVRPPGAQGARRPGWAGRARRAGQDGPAGIGHQATGRGGMGLPLADRGRPGGGGTERAPGVGRAGSGPGRRRGRPGAGAARQTGLRTAGHRALGRADAARAPRPGG
jgi:hypothetical protein